MDDLIATQGEMVEGEYTGQVAGIPSIMEGKVKRFHLWLQQNNIHPQHTTLYSDSINDLPLLSLVDKPIVVDPDDLLRDVAVKKQWEIISLKTQPLHLVRNKYIRIQLHCEPDKL